MDHDYIYGVDKAALDRFIGFCQRRRYPKKTVFCNVGDPADSLYYIIQGTVTVMMEDSDGREIILAYLNAGDFIGEMGLFFNPQQRKVMIRTRTPCEIAEMTYGRLRTLFAGHLRDDYPKFLYAVGMQLSQRLLHTRRQVSQLAFLDVSGRVARTLLHLCEQPDALSHPDGTQIHISRQEISRIVGCSREMVGRVIKEFQVRGMIAASGMTIVVHHDRGEPSHLAAAS
jgi:CRP/FNR family cyclic AMP-dependent transcriptional regulator